MKLNQKSTALALGTISAILAFLCTIFIAILPVRTMNFFGWLIHINNLAEIIGPRIVTLGNGLAGVAFFFILGYAIGWFFAVLYNNFSKNSQ